MRRSILFSVLVPILRDTAILGALRSERTPVFDQRFRPDAKLDGSACERS